ncbi:MAG: hypothetical protein IJB79_03685 [Candidatus Gastranaerophilales bacterium]|nr:hypothetical protein [Candidatus Gastranaerophilales bacterium]
MNTTKGQTAPNNRHEKVYLDLQKRAHEAKPNEAKAKMVKEGILGNPISATVDTIKDGANFFKAVVKGDMGDNNLGRINDLGLKIGAGLIATFLALHSKTKTESIMRFIGGGTFIAAMSLWPKLFINLPARLVHGFRIDRKYISAQGDKKDFFLDNQFLVWDAYPEEQLRKDASKAGIDYDSENGKEKIQRKMQKTALQNRTLWMATAGFATPLMTAMIGNFVEPEVEKAVIKHGVKKTKTIVEGGLAEYIKNAKANVQNADAIGKMAKTTEVLDDEFFVQLADLLSPVDFLDKFKNADDSKVLKEIKIDGVAEELKAIYSKLATCDETSLRRQLQTAQKASISKKMLSADDINAIVAELNGDFRPEKIASVLQTKKVAPESIKKVLANTKVNNANFFEFIENYNKGPVAQLRARLRTFADVVNPIVGSKSESASTLEYGKTMKKMFKGLGFKTADLKRIKDSDDLGAIKILSDAISKAVAGKSDAEYKAFLESITMGQMDDDILAIIETLQAEDTLKTISIDSELIKIGKDATEQEIDIKGLNKALLGGGGQGVRGILSDVIEAKKIDLDAVRLRTVLSANFERRLAAGEFGTLSDKQLAAARRMVYDGNLSTMKNIAYADNQGEAKRLAKMIFKKEAFSDCEKELVSSMKIFTDAFENEETKEVLSGFENYIRKIGLIFEKGESQSRVKQIMDYTGCSSLVDNMRTFARKLNNNKSWMKVFAPMAIVLVAVTLLVQPFFGKIDKEFPQEGKNGGAK